MESAISDIPEPQHTEFIERMEGVRMMQRELDMGFLMR
jgi:hypothetical protein